jgi:hypothetical protein
MVGVSPVDKAAGADGCEYRLDKDRVLPIFSYVFKH